MNDKIRYIHIGLPSGLTGMPVAYSFVGAERAEGSAREVHTRDTQGAQGEEADRSLANRSMASFSKGVRRVAEIVVRGRVVEIGFAQPLA
ncbi:hypothetical protein CMV30_11625 [Nibricoccus aquaticus]|uniref:Uncharacterized protein n=1 Tax=Nibricoccus aquaticus TaxID=2576891 RepID=A0A290QBI5_9BACT|nr:hypothetical protein [Nibricoccus aquaticus]ATC64550.1 hypothetical protein CMV30_11625 [Nibricoccus aquaticus]